MWILQSYITLLGARDDLKFSSLYIHLAAKLSSQTVA